MKKKNRIREWLSVQIAKRPATVILAAIFLLNICFFMIAAVVISNLAPETLENRGFGASVYYTISMILDAGCIGLVVEDVGKANVSIIIACIVVAVIGMITFTGAVIGYITNYISDFINSANKGENRLHVSNHIVILNWNSRASEIINDLLYSGQPENVVVLVEEGREAIEKEIEERIMATLEKERSDLRKACEKMGWLRGRSYYHKHVIRNRITVIVREGDTFSVKKLNDISISRARAVIILGKTFQNKLCKYDVQEDMDRYRKGNSHTVKTLIQVAEMTGSADSADNQKVVVEVEDEWTLELAGRVIHHKEQLEKCNIVPIAVNRILGQILSQFAIMPELNLVYGELFSNKGAAFFSRKFDSQIEDIAYINEYMKEHMHAIPLTGMDGKEGTEFYYIAEKEKDLDDVSVCDTGEYRVKVNPDYWLEKRNIIILGHNSKSEAVMEGFNAFRAEWNYKDPEWIHANGGPEILNIMVIDDEKSMERNGGYQKYPYVNHRITADVYDKQAICDAVNEFVDNSVGDTSILILSDDLVAVEEQDAKALTYLIYVQDIIAERVEKNPDFDRESIDVIVEILNPKNYDIVRSYSINNIVISNRYISKMVTQIGEKEAIFNFYSDILTYDEEGGTIYESKELYVKKVKDFFLETPKPCTAAQLIRATYQASGDDNKSIIFGYVRQGGELVIFSGDQEEIWVELKDTDKIILFSNH